MQRQHTQHTQRISYHCLYVCPSVIYNIKKAAFGERMNVCTVSLRNTGATEQVRIHTFNTQQSMYQTLVVTYPISYPIQSGQIHQNSVFIKTYIYIYYIYIATYSSIWSVHGTRVSFTSTKRIKQSNNKTNPIALGRGKTTACLLTSKQRRLYISSISSMV